MFRVAMRPFYGREFRMEVDRMNRFLGLYRWAMQMKLRMGIYTLALLLCKMAWNAIQGVNYVLSLEIVGMWIACLIFAMVETVILPQGKNPTPLRTVAWVLVGNGIFWGGSVWLGWFAGGPFWGGALLVLLLEAGLAAMWFGDHVAMRADSAVLNRQLRAFQRRQAEAESGKDAM